MLFVLSLGLVPGPLYWDYGRAEAQEFAKILPSIVSVLPDWPAGIRGKREPEGSGVVIFSGRHILTASHVIGRAQRILVRTHNGHIIKARLKARDRATDLALLEIDQALKPLKFGADPKLGARVCAIGNSFGLGMSISCGMVSALHRAGVGFNPVEDFIQTDAVVNPGASGGGLVDKQGLLVGILSAIFTKKSDANIGINFAVSAKLAKNVAEDLIKRGRVWRASSGLRLKRSPASKMSGELSAEVISIAPGSPGDIAGVKIGDKIISAADRRIYKPADFISALSLLRQGDSLKIKLRSQNGGTLNTLKLSF